MENWNQQERISMCKFKCGDLRLRRRWVRPVRTFHCSVLGELGTQFVECYGGSFFLEGATLDSFRPVLQFQSKSPLVGLRQGGPASAPPLLWYCYKPWRKPHTILLASTEMNDGGIPTDRRRGHLVGKRNVFKHTCKHLSFKMLGLRGL